MESEFRIEFQCYAQNQINFPRRKSLDFGDTTEQSWICWCLRGWCYEIITFMRISTSKTSRYVVSNLLLLEISISAFVLESFGSRSESRHEESICIFLILFRISKYWQLKSDLCQRLLSWLRVFRRLSLLTNKRAFRRPCRFSDWKRRTDCGSGLPPVSILQAVNVACLFGVRV